jgi:hypothetical protein
MTCAQPHHSKRWIARRSSIGFCTVRSPGGESGVWGGGALVLPVEGQCVHYPDLESPCKRAARVGGGQDGVPDPPGLPPRSRPRASSAILCAGPLPHLGATEHIDVALPRARRPARTPSQGRAAPVGCARARRAGSVRSLLTLSCYA